MSSHCTPAWEEQDYGFVHDAAGQVLHLADDEDGQDKAGHRRHAKVVGDIVQQINSFKDAGDEQDNGPAHPPGTTVFKSARAFGRTTAPKMGGVRSVLIAVKTAKP